MEMRVPISAIVTIMKLKNFHFIVITVQPVNWLTILVGFELVT